jgi:hypothetical protein
VLVAGGLVLAAVGAEEHGIIDRIDGAVGADRRGRVGFAGRRLGVQARAQGVGGEIPAVEVTVFAVQDGALVGRVDGRGVDAPFVNARQVGVLGWAQDRDHLVHHGGAADRIGHRGVGVENRDLVGTRAVDPRVGVIVILGEDQVGGLALVRSDEAAGHDRRRVVPAEGAGNLDLGQGRVEMQHPAPRVVGDEVTLEHPVVDVAVRPDRGRGGAIVRQRGRAKPGTRVVQKDAVLGNQRLARGNAEVARAEALGVDRDVDLGAVGAQGRGAIVDRLLHVGVAGQGLRGHERPAASGRDAGQAARDPMGISRQRISR